MLICFICHAGAYKLVFMAGEITKTLEKMKKLNKETFPDVDKYFVYKIRKTDIQKRSNII